MILEFLQAAAVMFIVSIVIFSAGRGGFLMAHSYLELDQKQAPSFNGHSPYLVDAQIVSEIKKYVFGRVGLASSIINIKITSRAGDVILKGLVTSYSYRQWIEQRAETVPHVRTVKNELLVQAYHFY